MSQTSVVLGLPQSLDILSVDGIHLVADHVGPGSLSGVLLSVQEPLGDVVLRWSGKDVTDGVDLLLGDLSGPLLDVNLGNLEGKESETSSNTSNLSETEGGLLFTVDVCVLDSQNMSEFVRVLQY